jgi:hypothetical protein
MSAAPAAVSSTTGETAATAATKDTDPPPAKKLRVTFTEDRCIVCAVPFAELLEVPKVVFGGCQHAACIPCVQKHQSLPKSTTACGCGDAYKFELRPPPPTASEPTLMKLTVTYRADQRFAGDGTTMKVSVMFEVSRDDAINGPVRISMVSSPKYARLAMNRWGSESSVSVPSNGKRVGCGMLIMLEHLMRQCHEDGSCSDYGREPCSLCNAVRDQSVDHIQFIATVKENQQLDLMFPDYQGPRADDLEVVIVTPSVANTVNVPVVPNAVGTARPPLVGTARPPPPF